MSEDESEPVLGVGRTADRALSRARFATGRLGSDSRSGTIRVSSRDDHPRDSHSRTKSSTRFAGDGRSMDGARAQNGASAHHSDDRFPVRWLVRDPRVALAGVAHEACLGLLEPELDLARGPVAVLGQLEVDHLAIGFLLLAGSFLLAPQEHHEVGVLLDRARLTQVRQTWLARLP